MFSRLTRDTAIVTFSLAAASYEILFGGGRPSVLTFLSGLLLAPLALRIDEVRRRYQNQDHSHDAR